MQFHYASDVALQFIESAAAPGDGAHVFNLGMPAVSVAEVVELIRRVKPDSKITHVEKPLPFPEEFPSERLKEYLPATKETPLEQGVMETISHFEKLLNDGKLSTHGSG